MSKLVCLDKDNDIIAIMFTDEKGNFIADRSDIPTNCVVLFVDKEEWKVQSK